MEKIRVGLIGCGGISHFHIDHLLKFDDVKIVAVADPRKDRREAMAKKTGAERMYADHNALYDAESLKTLDCVYICVEPTAHENTELRAIEMGIPFLVEKPMHLDLAAAEDISRRIEDKKLITAVGFQDRYLDIIEPMKDELSHHKTGLVYGAWVGGIPMVWWWLKKDTCGGQLVEQNIHLLDLLRYMFGEAKSVYATASRGLVTNVELDGLKYDTDDHSTAVIRFDNNITATLVSGCYFKHGGFKHNGITVICDDMTIEYNLRHHVTFTTPQEVRTVYNQVDQGIKEDRTFIDAVRTGDGSKIRSPYSDSLKSLRLGLAANESMETGQVVYIG